ncbi:uncharacterized protein LOC125701581 [Lagopus muta]|uniref:uncharacterized protein LOC125701581 n=1 Tax=Lagopus muta TaxID=64668 RepID=UPI00209F8D67|nr:uncharacterized protein LOC125701581 [Lagopus muta]
MADPTSTKAVLGIQHMELVVASDCHAGSLSNSAPESMNQQYRNRMAKSLWYLQRLSEAILSRIALHQLNHVVHLLQKMQLHENTKKKVATTESQNHRITRVGRDPKDHVVPTPLPSRATKHTHSDQVAQDPVQPGLKHVQGRGIHNLPGQPVPGPNHSPSKELPPNIQPKSFLLQLKTISPSPAVVSPFEEFTPLLGVGSLQVLIGCNEVTPQPSLLQAEQAQLPQPVLIGEVLQPPDHLSRPPLDPFQNLNVFLVLRAPHLDKPFVNTGPKGTFSPKAQSQVPGQHTRQANCQSSQKQQCPECRQILTVSSLLAPMISSSKCLQCHIASPPLHLFTVSLPTNAVNKKLLLLFRC